MKARHHLSAAAAIAAITVLSGQAPPATPTPAPAQYDPRSTDAAPCGQGRPAYGQFPVEVDAGRSAGLHFTVKQDGNRLCYVSDGIAEAPVIRVRQGQDLAITLRNEITDPAAIGNFVGIGQLDDPNPPEPTKAGFYGIVPGMHHPATGATNLHVHGFAVPPTAPQDDVLETCLDPATGPATCGRREFAYRYRIPATMPAGLYWYHPHVHGEAQPQILMGLSGAIVVEGPEDDARRAAGIEDRILIVRQTQDLDARTSISPGLPPPPEAPKTEHKAAPAAPSRPRTDGTAIDTADELLCSPNAGIDKISLNGAPVVEGIPDDTQLAHYEVPAGTPQLWRVLNAATDAFLDLALVDEDGTKLPVTVVARDGAPLTNDAGARLSPNPSTEPEMVPPSGRVEFLVSAPQSGHRAYLMTRAVDTGCAGDGIPERRLALVTAGPPAPAVVAQAAPAKVAAPDFFSGLLSRKTDRERVIALAEYPRPGVDDQTDFYIVERKPGAVLRPFEMGDAPAVTVKAGTTEEWVVENWTHELHAFHMHQVHFRVLAVNGAPLADPPLLDVVNVPYATAGGYHSKDGPVIPGRVRIKVYFPEELAGDIPFHCHLVDHEDNGMMAVLRVVPATASKLPQKAELSLPAALEHPPICRPKRQS